MAATPAAVEIVHAFRFCPRCGAEAFAAKGAGALECGACGFRHFINASVAVGTLLTDDADRVLLIRRAREPGKGLFGIPAGFAAPGETAEEAARRETREEIGVEPGELQYLTSYPNRYHYRGLIIPVLDLFFTTRVPAGEFQVAPDEVEDVLFLHVAAVEPERLAFDSIRHALTIFTARQAR